MLVMDAMTSYASRLVPARAVPDRDLRGALEHLTEELLDLRIGRERLDRLRGLPLVDPEEVPIVQGVPVHAMGDVPRLHRHVLGGCGHLVVDLLDGPRFVPQPPSD